MNGKTPAETALAADGGAGAQLAAGLMTAARYIQARPGQAVPEAVQADVRRALGSYKLSMRLAAAS